MKPKKEILKILDNALVNQFTSYSWFNMIDDTELSEKEKEWAKENTGYMVRDYTKGARA